MQIKKLEINGFKSFAEPVVVEFHPGITMLVGPNGCGKTNVVDAIRWVLGERSALRLRGERMENVIFAGTTRRQPLGMAEVILTITDDGEPATEDSLTLSRRVFRDGESLYKLNKNSCRLKDVEEFLIDKGIGTGGYLVLEQDMVDMIISERPEERRNLLDEAAGIVRYKRRKDEALRKLEATRGNLARVQDVVNEVCDRLEVLKKQATRTRRAKRLSASVRELEYRIIIVHGYGLKGRLEEFEQKARQAELEEAQAAAQLADADAKAEEARQASDEAAEALIAKREKVHQFQRELDAQINREELLGERIEHQREIVQSSLHEVENNQEQSVAFRKEITEVENRIKTNKEELAKIQVSKSEVERIFATKEQELKQDREQANKIGEELQNGMTRLTEIIKEDAEAQAHLDGISVHLGRLSEEKASLERQIEETGNHFSELMGRINQFKSEVEKSQVLLASKTMELEKVAKKKAKAQVQYDELAAKQDSSRSRLESLESEIARLQSPLSRFEGALPPPSQWLHVPPELELAVAAVIGELLSAPILPDLSNLTQAYEQLKTKSGWLLWLQKVVLSHKSPPVGFGRLLDFLKYPQEYASLMEGLLGSVLLLDEMSAEMIAKLGMDWMGVTKEGVVANKQSMGYPAAARLAEELSLQREIGECRSALEELEKLLNESKLELDHLVSDEEKSRKLEHNACEALDKNRTLLQKSEAEQVNLKSTQESLIARAEVTTAEEESLLLEKSEQEQINERIVRDKDKWEERLSELRKKETELRQVIKEKEVLLEETWQEVMSISTQENEYANLVKNDQRQLQWVTTQLENITTQCQSLEAQAANANLEVKKNSEELNRLRANIKGKEKEQEKLTQMLREAEEILSQTRGRTAACDDLARKHGETHKRIQDNTGELKAMLLLAEAEWANIKEKAHAAGFELTQQLVKEGMPELGVNIEEMQKECDRIKESLMVMGEVNYLAEEELSKEEERHAFLTEQMNDLKESESNLLSTINTLDRNSKDVLLATLERVNTNFQSIFDRLFEGGEAALVLPQGEDPITGNLEIITRPPGKRTRHINLLSGGEKALSAIALLFALFMERPSPFCILDEIDAPLDDANVQRFLRLLADFSISTQFLIITHNKRTMEAADSLIGVSMSEPGVSTMISLKLSDVDDTTEYK